MECRNRINKHKSTIRTGRHDLPVSKHFIDLEHNIKDLNYWIVDHVPKLKRGGDRSLKLKRLELEWIQKLDTL